jgi:hypothetical protein
LNFENQDEMDLNYSGVFHNNSESTHVLSDTEDFQPNSEYFQKSYNKFPNDAYADLMALVLKNNLSNTTGNEIISFFNKHSNLSISPLPKNIQQGHIFMNKMKQPNLEFLKTCVLNYNGVEYFLYHFSLINCIKNILEIPNISQYFALGFEELYNQVLLIFCKLKFNNY